MSEISDQFGRGRFQVFRRDLIPPPPGIPFATAKCESRVFQSDFFTAKCESRAFQSDFFTAKCESRVVQSDFFTAKCESRVVQSDLAKAKPKTPEKSPYARI